MKMKRSDVDSSDCDKCADTYAIKLHISANVQNDSDDISTFELLMIARYCAFKMMDAMYTPVNKAMMPIPNLREVVDDVAVVTFDIKNPMMHAKYNTMHDPMIMEETARMLLVTTSSIKYLIMNPAIGKNINDFSNMSLFMICYNANL
jgi:hypothetical protein